jgi:glucokinase
MPNTASRNGARAAFPIVDAFGATIGIDLGGTKTLFALFDARFRVVEKVKVRTRADKGEKYFTRVLEEHLETLLAAADKKKLRPVAVGMGCAGFIDPDSGRLLASPNIPFLSDVPLKERLARFTGLPVTVANDVHAGLYGEAHLGAAVGCDNVIGIFVGTGVGGAVMIGRRLHVGASGAGGEIGHFLVDPMGPLAGSGRLGTLDDVVSRNAISAAAAALALKQWAPFLYRNAGTDMKDITSGNLARSVRGGDKHVEELVRSRSRILGIVMANLANFLSPDMIVLGGGLVEAMPRLIVAEAEKALREFTIPPVAKRLRVAASKLKGFAVAAGAAKMAFDLLAVMGDRRLDRPRRAMAGAGPAR